VPGQRWVSASEPELGLGTVLQISRHQVVIVFPLSGETRSYAVSHAPLNRVQYAIGDKVSDGAGVCFHVETIEHQAGLVLYHGAGQQIPEGALDDRLAFNRPQDRLVTRHPDRVEAFERRQRTWDHLCRYRSSPLRGLLGGRISLIPHQLYVVESVVQRITPRVLLSDEIGMGKTIEACLILHRKLMLGRINRALILVPTALVYQWFVELLRRFSLLPAIFDEERCEAIEANPESGNPFLEDHLILCDINWLAGSEQRANQAVDAGWDLLIVDEAHHLEWEDGRAGPSYSLVDRLAASTHGVLLLTATPEELGGSGHFARLRLLDPDRYTSLEDFDKENLEYAPLVPLAETLETKGLLSDAQAQQLVELGLDPGAAPERLLDELIDCYGPGRVIFRNTRRIIKGFPERMVHMVALENADGALLRWLIGLLQELPAEKFLAIVHTRAEAEALCRETKAGSGVAVSLFHEGMTLLQRDQQAAWFAEPDGARLLIASEIGGEGRNFQFAHHLVLLDVPANPELIEQRIGRLDRIGQSQRIHIHVPYRMGTGEEIRARWMHEVLDALRHPLPGAHEIYLRFCADLTALESAPASAEWTAFMQDARAQVREISERVSRGRDRLLELHSYRADQARHWADAIAVEDADPSLEAYLLEIFEAYGVYPEQIDGRRWLLKPDAMFSHLFPGFPRDGMMITFDRQLALAREDIGFVSWDHPLVHGAMEKVVASADGNAAVVSWDRDVATRFLFAATFILEASGSDAEASRCLPATPIRLVLNESCGIWDGEKPVLADLRDAPTLSDRELELVRLRLPDLVVAAEIVAGERASGYRRDASLRLQDAKATELRRLRALQKRNVTIGDRELQDREDQFDAAVNEVLTAALRLDSVCWIWTGSRVHRSGR